jgi:hypothetical protein
MLGRYLNCIFAKKIKESNRDDEIDVWKLSNMIRKKNHKMQHKNQNSKKSVAGWLATLDFFQLNLSLL